MARLFKSIRDLYGDDETNVHFPVFRVLVTKLSGKSFLFSSQYGGVSSFKITDELSLTENHVISKAEIMIENTSQEKIVQSGPNGEGITVGAGDGQKPFSVTEGDLITVWAGYQGVNNLPLIFSGVASNVSSSMRARIITVQAYDSKSFIFGKFEIGSTEAFNQEGAEQTIGLETTQDATDWVKNLARVINDQFKDKSEQGLEPPFRIIVPESTQKSGYMVKGADLDIPGKAISVMDNLAFKGDFIWDLVNVNTEPFSNLSVTQMADKNPSEIGEFNLVISPRFKTIDNFDVTVRPVFFSQEGEDVIDIKFLEGENTVNVVTVKSRYDIGVSATFPPLSEMSEYTFAQLTQLGMQEITIITTAKTTDECFAQARQYWQTLGGHQKIETEIMGNPLVSILDFYGVVSNFFKMESIFIVSLVEHSFSASNGFRTRVQAFGPRFDDKGNIFNTDRDISEEFADREDQLDTKYKIDSTEQNIPQETKQGSGLAKNLASPPYALLG